MLGELELGLASPHRESDDGAGGDFHSGDQWEESLLSEKQYDLAQADDDWWLDLYVILSRVTRLQDLLLLRRSCCGARQPAYGSSWNSLRRARGSANAGQRSL